MTAITEHLSAALTDRYTIERELSAGEEVQGRKGGRLAIALADRESKTTANPRGS